jgi:DNA-binding CsgD family transcriptional regulator
VNYERELAELRRRRDAEITRLAALGKSRAAIARAVGVRPSTVKYLRSANAATRRRAKLRVVA